MLTRRHLLSALSMYGASSSVLGRALAQPAAGAHRTLVALFLRGGVDGLSMVPPVGDPGYAALRPTLRLLPTRAGGDDAALALDDTFGFHPALRALLPAFQAKSLAVVHAVGQALPSRSHFDAQDFLESGTPGRKRADGYLNRAAVGLGGEGPFRLVAVQTALPLALSGDSPAVAFPSLKQFRVGAGKQASATFETLYADSVDEALRSTAREAFAGVATAGELAALTPHNGAKYPASPLGGRLADIARLIHADAGLTIAATEAGGFDTHLAQGAGKGQLASRLQDFGDSLGAFLLDLQERLSEVCVVVMTEFGRTAKENGTRGTDHGTASVCLVAGGGVRGGRVVSDWPGLAPGQLHEGRDLRVTTDVRDVLAEALSTLGAVRLGDAFPDYAPRRLGLFG